MTSKRTAPWALMLAAVVGVLAPPSVRAQVSWAIAEREEAQILSLVGKLTPFVEKLPGEKDAAGVILFAQNSFDMEEKKTRACTNRILEVRDPAQIPERMLAPFTPSGITLDAVHGAWIRDGKVQKLDEKQMRHEPGREDIGRGRARFDWPELKKGDTLVLSMVFEWAGPLPTATFPVAEVFPSVITNLTLHGNHRYNYEIDPVGFPASELDVKQSELSEGRPKTIKASVNAQPAVDDFDPTGTLPESVPHLMVRLTEIHLDPPEGSPVPKQWFPVEGWNQLAVQLASMPGALAEKAGNVEVLLTALTTGKNDDVAKADAIFGFVHDKVALLEGDDIVSQAVRELSEVMSAKEATATEKSALMAVLLHEAGVPFQVGLLRDPQYGPLHREWPARAQFSDMILRVGAETPRYYAPQCVDCEGETYPAAWSGIEVFLTVDGLAETAKEKNEAWRKEAMVAGTFDLRAMQAKMNAMDWHHFETLP